MEKSVSEANGTERGWARYVEHTAPHGAQGTVRIAALLRIIAAHNSAGMKLQEIADLAELEQSTAHRIVTALNSVGFLSREAGSRRYHLGPLLFELFTTAYPHFNIRDLCLPAMRRLAQNLGDTVYLSVRSGFDGICVERVEGSFPIRTCTVEVGARRPLGVGAASLALLSTIGEIERQTILSQCAPRYGEFGLSVDTVLQQMARQQDRGYVYQFAVSSNAVKAVSLPILGRSGHAFGSLSITAIADRMPADRAEEIATEMRKEIAGIEKEISKLGYV